MDEITISRETAEEYIAGAFDNFERKGAVFYKGNGSYTGPNDRMCIVYESDMQRLLDGDKDELVYSTRECTLSLEEQNEHTLTEILTVEREVVENNGDLAIKDSGEETQNIIECSCGETFDDDEEALDHINQPHEIEQILEAYDENVLRFEENVDSYLVDIEKSKIGCSRMGALKDAGYYVSGILRVDSQIAEEEGYDTENVIRFWLREE